MLHFYTDGSSHKLNNNSCGGYGITTFDDNETLIGCCCQQFSTKVTNNQMELMAILRTFEIKNEYHKNEPITIYSDSAYCINALSSWIYTWCNNGWENSQNKIIENYNIFKSLYLYYNKEFFISQIEFKKIPGHAGIIGNELSDALAQGNGKKFEQIILEKRVKLDPSLQIFEKNENFCYNI